MNAEVSIVDIINDEKELAIVSLAKFSVLIRSPH